MYAKNRTLFFFSLLFFLCAVCVFSQEGSSSSDENQNQEVVQNDDGDSQNAANTETKTLTKKERIKALYDEYWKKSGEVNENQRITGSQMVADFITDKLPLTLDLGAEPGEHGSTVFGVFQYDWTAVRSSRLRLEYQGIKRSEDMMIYDSNTLDEFNADGEGIGMIRSKMIGLELFPYLRYFGDDDRYAKTPFFYFGFGGFYRFSWTDGDYTGWLEYDYTDEDDNKNKLAKGLYKMEAKEKYHQFGPMITGAVKWPFLHFFGITLETTYSPINRVISTADAFMTSYWVTMDKNESAESEIAGAVEKESQSQTIDTAQWCSPLIKVNLSVEAFTYFRFRTRFGYSRIYTGNPSSINLVTQDPGDESRQETFLWRYGLEIVFPSSNRTRKKDSHLWAGLYYEQEWDITTNNSDSNTEHFGRWLFCFGT